MTTVFTALAFAQLARAMATRSFREPVWRTGVRGNAVLLGMAAAALVLQLAAVYLPFAQEFFGTAALDAAALGGCAALAVAVLAVMELDKALRRRADRAGAA
jgi:magnesium-transporting ATPase (P-type)